MTRSGAGHFAAVVAAFVCGALVGGVGGARRSAAGDLAALKAEFRRPAAIPFPASNPYSAEKRALGERLFHDKRLSADGSIACATCHDRAQGLFRRPRHGDRRAGPAARAPYADAVESRLGRHRVLGRPRAQPGGAGRRPDHRAGRDGAADRRSWSRGLRADRDYARAFAKAFPDEPRVSEENLKKAIATYERTLVSPPTRFDRWIAGDAAALSAQEVEGFRLFTGKAGCANCHAGWAFTDYAFHDIGLPSDDRGRGAVLRLEQAEHAFKTPCLREVGRARALHA